MTGKFHTPAEVNILKIRDGVSHLFTYTPSSDPDIACLQREAAERLLNDPEFTREPFTRHYGESEVRAPYREPSEWTIGFWDRYHAEQNNKVDISEPRYKKPEVIHVPRTPLKHKAWDYHATHGELFLDEIKEAIRYNCGSEIDLRCLDVTYLHESGSEWEI